MNASGHGRRGGGRVPGSAQCHGRGHSSRKGGGGRGYHGLSAGVELPNASSRSRVLADGLSYVGFDESRQKCREGLLEQRFRAHYGVGSAALTRAIADLKRYQPNKQHDLRLLLMAASWLKLYDSEEVMAGRWQFGEKYCRETVREYVSRLQDLKPFKITFEGMSPTCTFAAVDTVHLRSQEFRCAVCWRLHWSWPPFVADVQTAPGV